MISCHLSEWTVWPVRPTQERRNDQFKVNYPRLLDDLSHELERIDAVSVVLQLDLASSMVSKQRNSYTGWPKTDTRPRTPGVILSFEAFRNPIQMPCDTYLDWQGNLRAIGLTLKALRDIERYGASQRHEQYTGYTALPPPPSPNVPSKPTDGVAGAATFLEMWSGIPSHEILNSVERLKAAYREAVSQTHPDSGGNPKSFILVTEAYEMLKVRHGIK